MSRIGKKPIQIPQNIKINIDKNNILVEGPKGKLNWSLPLRLTVELKERTLIISRKTDSKIDKTFQGTARSIINNMVQGVNAGYSKELEIIGVGYRAQVNGKKLVLQIGFSHPVEYEIPAGINVETPKPTSILVKGIDKARVGQTAAEIRAFYKPEPYKGKGIRYVGEHVRRKAGKAAA
ncbi:MAG: 50S ribosomal protein L6 [Candidatus Omnitrophota bacterium]